MKTFISDYEKIKCKLIFLAITLYSINQEPVIRFILLL